jgi:hypothetical protein
VFDSEKVRELQLRKQQLLVESELNRRTVLLEADRIGRSFSWVSSGWEMFKVLRPFWVVAAPVAGFSIARKWRQTSNRWRKGLLLVKLVYKGWQTVQNVRRAIGSSGK